LLPRPERRRRDGVRVAVASLTKCIFKRYTSLMAKPHPLADVDGFDWDDGNIGKNWPTHQVTDWECEEVFFNQPLTIGSDTAHSMRENRYYVLGQTDRKRWLFGSFTIRNRLIRPISFRDMNARERKSYESAKEDTDVQG
jgi:uncharacterized DUF497 family protein